MPVILIDENIQGQGAHIWMRMQTSEWRYFTTFLVRRGSRMMSESREEPVVSRPIAVAVLAGMVQLIIWSFTLSVLDGYVLLRGCTIALAAFWLLVALVSLIASGERFRWFVALSAWLMTIGCAAWVCYGFIP